MLTPSVNIVQSAFPEEKQGEISGLSRSVSNLGSSFGTAIAGTILVSDLVSGNGTYVAAMIVLAVVAVAGLGIAILLPTNPVQNADSDIAPSIGSIWRARYGRLIRRSSTRAVPFLGLDTRLVTADPTSVAGGAVGQSDRGRR